MQYIKKISGFLLSKSEKKYAKDRKFSDVMQTFLQIPVHVFRGNKSLPVYMQVNSIF